MALEEKISELELARLESQKELIQMKNKLEDALQAQETYKGILKRI